MSTTPRSIADAVAASASKRQAAHALGVTASRIGSAVHEIGDPALSLAWRMLPADGAFVGASALPRPSPSQALADDVIRRAVEAEPIDPAATQRRNVVDILAAALRLGGNATMPRGWVRSVVGEFDRCGHPRPPTPSSLRWYYTRLCSEPATFADVPAVASLLKTWPPDSALWRREARRPAVRSVTPRSRSKAQEDQGQTAREAAEDEPIDPARSVEANCVLLLLSLYNITGTLEWPQGWANAVSGEFERAGVRPPTKGTLLWYRKKLKEDPAKFSGIEGVDPQLIEDLLAR